MNLVHINKNSFGIQRLALLNKAVEFSKNEYDRFGKLFYVAEETFRDFSF
jgi:hypothetical protein